MPDELDVSGGSTAVATEDLEEAARQLAQLNREAEVLAADLGRLEPPFMRSSAYVDQARIDIQFALAAVREVAALSAEVAFVLVTAGRGYVVTERAVRAIVTGAQGVVSHLLGGLVPGWLLSAGFGVSLAGGVLRVSGGLDDVLSKPFEKSGIPKAPPFLRDHNYLVNNAVTVGAIRAATQNLGPFLQGVAGVSGPRSFEFGAKGVVGLGRSLDLFQETGVRLVETKAMPVTSAPTDYVDRLARVPYREDGSGPQVVIEKYTVPGEPDRFCVYITGTATFSPVATDQPWDLTSNLVNATGDESGSVASVRLAMESAGVGESSPVQFTGYSQGGGTAARLAASGLYNSQGLVTFGGPTGQVPLPHDLPAVLVEHSDDPVPALGGEQGNWASVLVRRDVFAGVNLPTTYGVPSHHIEYYLQTARLMDESGSPQLETTIAKLDAFTAGTTLASSTAYRFERTP